MASTTSPTASLAVTLAQAITYLTRPLITRYAYSATTIIRLQLALEANLTAQFGSSWVPSRSGRRCLTLSPNGSPPRPIYNACKSAGVEWYLWIAALGNVEFDLFLDPGCVSVRCGNRETTIWSEQVAAPAKTRKEIPEQQLQAQLRAQAYARASAPLSLSPSKTVAQQLIEEDDHDDELFAMIADEIREPTWLTPVTSDFPTMPAPQRAISSSPVSIISTTSTHSRSSSRSSNSSSGFTFFTNSSSDSATTISLSSSDNEKPKFKLSRRERARQARVFVDSSKTEVTNYDGGKTTVLTGGVMLGGGAAAKVKPIVPSQKKTTSSSSCNWRTIRV
ncbi:unnamed protein product [Somion occarium]|uniref:Anti-proliferative protein domain-containing protein n=1 Tax=Somion occarium TaxID=3059160 RepID=A0ABP1CL60_9APHY